MTGEVNPQIPNHIRRKRREQPDEVIQQDTDKLQGDNITDEQHSLLGVLTDQILICILPLNIQSL